MLVAEFANATDGNAYAGVFGEVPEVSFHFMSKSEALKVASQYNQVSIWDWENMNEIPNENYKKGAGNDV